MNYPIHAFTREENSPLLPPELWNIQSPPKKFYIQGANQSLQLLQSLPTRGLAVVGTRNPQSRSLQNLRQWILDLSGSSLIIISGFARGIDAAAHQAALDAGLPTIAILGAGLDITYPREHFSLREKILEAGGLLVSEFPPGTHPRGPHFLLRNRLIATWSHATWVVEAPMRSGALNTAKWAREHHRTCYATACYPGDPALAGNQKILDLDAATPFWGPHSLGSTWLELSNDTLRHNKQLCIPFTQISPDEQALLAQVERLTFQHGSAQVQDLLDFSIQIHGSPQRFFETLQGALRKGLLTDKNGHLLKSAAKSD